MAKSKIIKNEDVCDVLQNKYVDYDKNGIILNKGQTKVINVHINYSMLV